MGDGLEVVVGLELLTGEEVPGGAGRPHQLEGHEAVRAVGSTADSRGPGGKPGQTGDSGFSGTTAASVVEV